MGRFSTSVMRLDDDNIKDACIAWCDDRERATEMFGHISDWDVSGVTCFHDLFFGKKDFNEDISKWDVSKARTMDGMPSGEAPRRAPSALLARARLVRPLCRCWARSQRYRAERGLSRMQACFTGPSCSTSRSEAGTPRTCRCQKR